MASIDGNTVSSMRGTIQRPQASAELVTRPGVAGYGWIGNAARAPISTVETVTLVASAAAADTLMDTYAAIPASGPVAVVDGLGVTHTPCLVLSVEGTITAITGVSGSTHAVTCTWTLIAEAT